jgi:hypothetical protein
LELGEDVVLLAQLELRPIGVQAAKTEAAEMHSIDLVLGEGQGWVQQPAALGLAALPSAMALAQAGTSGFT